MASTVHTEKVHVSELTGRITLKIRGLAGFAIRLRIATWLFRLGARIAGVNIVIEK